ncbi:hypothetical protein [Rossellomorea vietnamensis]|uniref:hypothetical protein n=1 Tax=Rossellomorea vietnamensis TaxID=218284 RepID=UPI00077C9677|nr:hypothetical protein [Rossellomorea vietnamensis]
MIEELHSLIDYIGLIHVILCLSLLLFFFIFSIIDLSLSFWSLVIMGFIFYTVLNINDAPWSIFEKTMIYGMFCAGGWIIAVPFNIIISLMNVGEIVVKKIRKWAEY